MPGMSAVGAHVVAEENSQQMLAATVEIDLNVSGTMTTHPAGVIDPRHANCGVDMAVANPPPSPTDIVSGDQVDAKIC